MKPLNDYQRMYEYEKDKNKRMVITCLNSLTKTELIEYLLKRKIISQDWTQKGNKYKLRGFN